jgi:Domain of unknown function (DUF1929)/Bacterial tandem repeat domain 1
VPDGLPDRTEEKVEIFKPWYYSRPDRPVVTRCPAKIATDGGVYTLGIGASQGANIGKVALVRAGSVTHAFDTDQRLVWLDILNTAASSVTLKSPYGAAAAPPGDYMLLSRRHAGGARDQLQVAGGAVIPSGQHLGRQGERHALVHGSLRQGERRNVFHPHRHDRSAVPGRVHQAGGRGPAPVLRERVHGERGAEDLGDLGPERRRVWSARHAMTAAAYQTEWDNQIGQSYQTRRVAGYQAGGTSRFVALWTRK